MSGDGTAEGTIKELKRLNEELRVLLEDPRLDAGCWEREVTARILAMCEEIGI